MKQYSKIDIIIDSKLISDMQSGILESVLNDQKISFSQKLDDQDLKTIFIVFVKSSDVGKYKKKNNIILVTDSNEEMDPLLESINFNSYDEVTEYVEKIELIERRIFFQDKIKDSEKKFEILKFENNEKIQKNEIHFSELQQKSLESIFDLEISLLGEEVVAKWNVCLKEFCKKNAFISDIFLVNSLDLIHLDLEKFKTDSLILQLPLNDLFLAMTYKNESMMNNNQLIDILISTVIRSVQFFDQQIIRNNGEIDLWKKVFSKIPHPMSVISDLGDLLIYNELFARIGILPKECLRIKDHESFEVEQEFFKVRRIDFMLNSMSVSYFVFYSSVEEKNNFDKSLKSLNVQENRHNSVDELGIISSSIAHELNNPLAGILAALSLLNLEDEWALENRADLDDMKNGAKRCKELVEIFLGFSKFSPSLGVTPSINSSLDQAINLLRFRMIEANLRVEIRYIPTLEKFSHQVNTSIMSMILYLIISELMTACAHERLITQINSNYMSGEVMEFSNQIVIKILDHFEYEEKLAQSKLIQHLLTFEKLEMNFLKKEIRLIFRS